MLYAKIYAVPAPGSRLFVWRWCTADGRKRSRRAFDFYFHCLEDARRKGYRVELTHAYGITAPGAEAGSHLR